MCRCLVIWCALKCDGVTCHYENTYTRFEYKLIQNRGFRDVHTEHTKKTHKHRLMTSLIHTDMKNDGKSCTHTSFANTFSKAWFNFSTHITFHEPLRSKTSLNFRTLAFEYTRLIYFMQSRIIIRLWVRNIQRVDLFLTITIPIMQFTEMTHCGCWYARSFFPYFCGKIIKHTEWNPFRRILNKNK